MATRVLDDAGEDDDIQGVYPVGMFSDLNSGEEYVRQQEEQEWQWWLSAAKCVGMGWLFALLAALALAWIAPETHGLIPAAVFGGGFLLGCLLERLTR